MMAALVAWAFGTALGRGVLISIAALAALGTAFETGRNAQAREDSIADLKATIEAQRLDLTISKSAAEAARVSAALLQTQSQQLQEKVDAIDATVQRRAAQRGFAGRRCSLDDDLARKLRDIR